MSCEQFCLFKELTTTTTTATNTTAAAAAAGLHSQPNNNKNVIYTVNCSNDKKLKRVFEYVSLCHLPLSAAVCWQIRDDQ